MQRFATGFIVASLGLAMAAACAQTSPMYRMTVLPVVGGDVTYATITAMNETGAVTGRTTVDKPGRPKSRLSVFRWTPEGGVELPPDGEHGPSSAEGIDGTGRVFGNVSKRYGFRGGVLWNRDGRVRPVERGPSGYDSNILAVNERGDAVGTRFLNRPTFWPRVGEPLDIGDGTDTVFRPAGINQQQQVTGTANSPTEAYVWSPTDGAQLLGLLPGSSKSGITTGQAINDHGTVLGGASKRRFAQKEMFLWTLANGFEVIPADRLCDPVAINNSDWVVAYCSNLVDDAPVLWTRENGLQLIADLIDPDDPLRKKIDLIDVSDINSDGTIVGGGTRSDGSGPLVLPVVLTRVR
jgi:hypothetical protein